jgi:hypothetical protein
MKSIIISAGAIILSFAFVITCALLTHRILGSILNEVETAEAPEDFDIISQKFERAESFLSFTLSDNSICEIEYSILEVRDYLTHGSLDEAMAAKSRLISKIKEHRRLSGVNPRSIF